MAKHSTKHLSVWRAADPYHAFVGEQLVRILLQIGLVALGSALGGLARWAVTSGTTRTLGGIFPWGTFLINISGSFALGWLTTVLAHRFAMGDQNTSTWLRPDDLRLVLAVGFCGAFTTFSTFEYEAHSLLRGGNNWAGTLYLIGSVVLGLSAVRLGIAAAEWK